MQRFTIYDVMEKNGVFRTNPANAGAQSEDGVTRSKQDNRPKSALSAFTWPRNALLDHTATQIGIIKPNSALVTASRSTASEIAALLAKRANTSFLKIRKSPPAFPGKTIALSAIVPVIESRECAGAKPPCCIGETA